MEVAANLKKNKMVFEETELRLGLPGNINGPTKATEVVRKRAFSQTQTQTQTQTVDLMLNLSPKEGATDPHGDNPKENTLLLSTNPPAKAQVVGWPPVRKNMFAAQKKSTSSGDKESEKKKSSTNTVTNGNTIIIIISFVKVSMDGAPYLRKVDLKMYNSYSHLSDALGKMFSSFTIGNCESEGIKDLMKESNKLMDILNSSDYVPTYEDKDGDWMLVGDVPWEMFVESCKRLRIMKGKEAIGLAPRAMEKMQEQELASYIAAATHLWTEEGVKNI